MVQVLSHHNNLPHPPSPNNRFRILKMAHWGLILVALVPQQGHHYLPHLLPTRVKYILIINPQLQALDLSDKIISPILVSIQPRQVMVLNMSPLTLCIPHWKNLLGIDLRNRTWFRAFIFWPNLLTY